MKKDLSLMINDTKLNIRVGAIIKYKNQILVEKNKNVDFYVVPGGRIQTLENSKEALLRELNEELGIDFSKEDFNFISFVENFFTFNNNNYHELYLLYEVILKNDYNLKNGMKNLDNINTNYYLIDIEEFKNIKVLPNTLKEIVNQKNFSHYIVNDLNK